MFVTFYHLFTYQQYMNYTNKSMINTLVLILQHDSSSCKYLEIYQLINYGLTGVLCFHKCVALKSD